MENGMWVMTKMGETRLFLLKDLLMKNKECAAQNECSSNNNPSGDHKAETIVWIKYHEKRIVETV